jgi:hypothetical protein
MAFFCVCVLAFKCKVFNEPATISRFFPGALSLSLFTLIILQANLLVASPKFLVSSQIKTFYSRSLFLLRLARMNVCYCLCVKILISGLFSCENKNKSKIKLFRLFLGKWNFVRKLKLCLF